MLNLAELTGLGFLGASWLPEVLLVLAGVLLLSLLAGNTLRRIERVTRQTETVWDDALIHAVKRPLTVLLWVLGLTHVAGVLDRETGAHVLEYAHPARIIGVIACLAWFLTRMINNAAESVMAQRGANGGTVDHTTVDAMSKLGRVSVIIVASLVILQTLGFSIAGVLAFSGIGGIAIGFAAKDLLANFFGGLMVYLDRPFSVGDWIRSPDKAIEGTVEYIGWRQTRIRGFNKNPIYVPNALFTTIVVENPSRMSHRRIKEIIGIRYQDVDKMAAITRDVKAMLIAHPDIDNEATMIVNFTTFSASSIDFMIYTFTTITQWVRYQEIKQDVLLKVAEVIAAHGAEIAFPTRTLHIESGS
ncbi:MAG: mechanosensitive ion channel family protein [Pseudomonadota bacterium]|nr:mechanosensitive ion channel family protein [Pseudomonadota bacterium]MDP1902760.1 mechanosensitive ion channel family protein [Pseudomonadota bacterium]MDP2350994.1 mechanosensitive ion channel family protein [Pseudomonadota bacterium]